MVDLQTTTKQYLRVHEVVEILDANTRTVYRWCESGALDAVRIGGSWRVSVAGLRLKLGRAPATQTHSVTPTTPATL